MSEMLIGPGQPCICCGEVYGMHEPWCTSPRKKRNPTVPEPLTFDDVSLREEPVTIGKQRYVLREATGEAAAKYRSAAARCAKMGPDGKVQGIEGIGDVEPLLVSLCLRKCVHGDSTSHTEEVPISTVRGWPARIVKPLFDRAAEMSGLAEKGKDDGEALKNGQGS